MLDCFLNIADNKWFYFLFVLCFVFVVVIVDFVLMAEKEHVILPIEGTALFQ